MEQANNEGPRYIVRSVRGMGLGAGGFVVVDTREGSEWGLTIWRDEADRLAARWNAQDRALLNDVGAHE